VKYLGHIIGSGIRKPDDEKVATVKDMQVPETKKQVRRLIGFFSYIRDYIPNFAEIVQPLTDLTGKQVPNRVPWGEKENLAFEKLKEELCKATTQSMSIADFSKPYLIEVDNSDNTVGAALLQFVEGKGNRPIAFASQKLTATQKAWSTIEKEAYLGLTKFRDIKSAYHQIEVKPEHQWLTAFVWDGRLFQYTTAPFGRKGSRNSFVRAVQQLLYPIKDITASFVDDIAVHSL